MTQQSNIPKMYCPAVEKIQQRMKNFQPTIGIILGTGSGDIAQQIESLGTIDYADLPGFFKCSVAGHQGQMVFGYLKGHAVVCLKGRAHYYEGYDNETIQRLIRTLKLLGCERLFMTNAAASLTKAVGPGRLVLIKDHINFQFKNPLAGPNDDYFGPRFPDLTYAYDLELRGIARKVADKQGVSLIEGVYIGVLGPCYETPAEVRMFRNWGADVVGMSTVPEVIVARHCGLAVMAISIVTNLGAGLGGEVLSHEDVLVAGEKAAKELAILLGGVLEAI